jgi:urease accessory protein
MRLEDGARLAWAAHPLVLAAGCALSRRTEVDLACDAALLARDTLVLGRAGEEPGRLRSSIDIRHAGLPLHTETLDTGDRALLRSPAVLGDAKVLDTLTLFGDRAPDGAALQLAGPGSVLPVPARSLAAAERITAPALARWRAAFFAPSELLTGDHGGSPAQYSAVI